MFVIVFYALLCVHSNLAIILKRKRKLVALLLLSYRCIVTLKCSVTLPHGAVGWSAVCDGYWSTRTLVNSYSFLVNSYLSQLVPKSTRT